MKIQKEIVAALIITVGAVTAAVIGLMPHFSTGGPSAAAGTPPASPSTGPSPSAPAIRHYTYTVNPKKWAPKPVPDLLLAKGDVVTIKVISGHWTCASVAGPASIQGNPKYVATFRDWAVPSAPLCSLIGKIGNGPWQEVGRQPSFAADRSGTLALTADDLMPAHCPQPPVSTSCYTDNTGRITILITVR